MEPKKEVTDEQAVKWIKQDLRAALYVLNLVTSRPELLDEIAKVTLQAMREDRVLLEKMEADGKV